MQRHISFRVPEMPHLRPNSITEALIARLVQTFYARVRADADLGPIFEARLAGRWDRHLATMVDFWSSVTLTSGRYHGRPHEAHRELGLDVKHFERWLRLFEETASELCEGRAAATFIDRARRIADSLQIGLNIGPKALRLPASPVSSSSERVPFQPGQRPDLA